jgi:Flp pilus assembly protein TadD
MAQAAGLGTWIEHFLRPDSAANAESLSRLKALAQSADLDLQALALMALHVGYDQRPEVREFLVNQVRSLGPREDAVRSRWAIAADTVGNMQVGRGDLPGALRCLEKSVEIKPDNYVTLSHLALVSFRSGDADAAIARLQQAIQLKPHKAVLHFQLAQTFAQLGRTAEAIQSLEEGLKYAPDDRAAQGMLRRLRGL